MPLPAGLVAAMPSIIGGIAGIGGQLLGNRSNRQMAREQMNFQASQSSTQWQRAVADIKAAGLNPALAYGAGGNAAAGGASAVMGNPGAAGVSSARDAAVMTEQVKQLKEQTKGMQLENAKKKVELASYAGQGKPGDPNYTPTQLEYLMAVRRQLMAMQPHDLRGAELRNILMDLDRRIKRPQAAYYDRTGEWRPFLQDLLNSAGKVAPLIGAGIIGGAIRSPVQAARSAGKLFPAPNRRRGAWETFMSKNRHLIKR